VKSTAVVIGAPCLPFTSDHHVCGAPRRLNNRRFWQANGWHNAAVCNAGVRRAFPFWMRSILTEIYLCRTWS
jgi:hypothetical protein